MRKVQIGDKKYLLKKGKKCEIFHDDGFLVVFCIFYFLILPLAFCVGYLHIVNKQKNLNTHDIHAVRSQYFEHLENTENILNVKNTENVEMKDSIQIEMPLVNFTVENSNSSEV